MNKRQRTIIEHNYRNKLNHLARIEIDLSQRSCNKLVHEVRRGIVDCLRKLRGMNAST